MDNIALSETDVLEYVCDILSDIKYNGTDVFNAKYCNTCSYENCPARKHPHMVKVPTIV